MSEEQIKRLLLAAPMLVALFANGCKTSLWKGDISHLQDVEYGRSGFISDIEENEDE